MFALDVQRGDRAPSGLRVAGNIGLAGGASIRDRAGNDADPRISGVFPRARVDAAGPSVMQFGSLQVGRKQVSMPVWFNEPVKMTKAAGARPFIPVMIDGVPRRMTLVPTASRGTLAMFRYRAAPGMRLAPSMVELPAREVVASSLRQVQDLRGNRVASLKSPTDIVASQSTILENHAPGAVVANLTAIDADGATDSHTYALVAGAGSQDNARFRIESGRLVAATSFNFEEQRQFFIRLQAKDSGGLTTEKAMTFGVTDVNEPPTAVVLANAVSTIAETASTATPTKVGDIVVTDDALGSETITLSGPDAASFEVDGLALYLKSGVALDFETKPSYSVTVSVADPSLPASLPRTMTHVLRVADVNEVPTNVALSSTTIAIAENAGANAVVGILTTTDPDTSNLPIYTLVPGVGDTDNASFTIVGNQLQATASLDFEAKSSYALRIRSTDQGGLFFERAFVIKVTDVNEAPTAVALTNALTTINENTSTISRIKVADIVVTDDALGSQTISLGGTDAASFEFDGSSLYLKAGVTLDSATKPSFSATVRVADNSLVGSTAVTAAFTLAVTGMVTPPEVRTQGVLQPFAFQSTLPSGLQETMPITVGDRLYLLGGVSSGGVSTNQILSAQIDQNGDVGTFLPVAGISLAVPRHFGWATRVGNYVYVIGGFVGSKESGSTGTVERATINPDGTLGPFAVVPGVTLVTPRGGFAFINTGTFLTVTGGHNGNVASTLSSTERAVVKPDGSIETFQSVATPMTSRRWSMPGVRIDNYFYVLGGEGPNQIGTVSSLNTIERATIGSDGSLGAFSLVSATLSQARNRSGYAVLADKLYLFGGFTGTGFLTTVERGTISPTGELSGFGPDQVSTLAQGLENGVTIQVRDQAIYYIGGYNYQNTAGVARVQKAPILRV